MMLSLTSDLCLTSVAYIMEPTATGGKARWAPQARRVWAGAGPQRAARTGARHIVAASRLQLVYFIFYILKYFLKVFYTALIMPKLIAYTGTTCACLFLFLFSKRLLQVRSPREEPLGPVVVRFVPTGCPSCCQSTLSKYCRNIYMRYKIKPLETLPRTRCSRFRLNIFQFLALSIQKILSKVVLDFSVVLHKDIVSIALRQQ